MTNPEDRAIARQRLLIVLSQLLESIYRDEAVKVLATLRPTDMRSGGARVPGTSYELEVPRAAQAMQQLLALAGARADALLQALAAADATARLAALTGKTPPEVADLYAHCTADIAIAGNETLLTAMRRLYDIADKVFTLTHMRRIDILFNEWTADPASLDRMPVQKFVASFIRNMPP